MKLGINLPFTDRRGEPPSGAQVIEQARAIEAAGFDGIWIGDSISRHRATPDPLMWLAIAAAATEHVEVGTAVVQVPLRNPVELAQRALTVHALSRGRFAFGVGTGSTRGDFAALGVDFDARFRLLPEGVAIMRRLWNGEQVGEAKLMPWPAAAGGPRLLLGSWASETWLRTAARDYEGWLASGLTSFNTIADGIQRYRDVGGKRALLATVAVDLSLPSAPLNVDEPFNLRCGPEAAAERLKMIETLGFDDVLLRIDSTSEAELAAIRALAPRQHQISTI